MSPLRSAARALALLPLLMTLGAGCALIDALGDPPAADQLDQGVQDMPTDGPGPVDMGDTPDLDSAPDLPADMPDMPDMPPAPDMEVPDMGCMSIYAQVSAASCLEGEEAADMSADLEGDMSADMDVEALRPLQVEAGLGYTCALMSNHKVYCWGANQERQLGLNVVGVTEPREPVTGLPADVEEIALGAQHACARTGAGEVWCWGSNKDGQRGDGTIVPGTASSAASKVSLLQDITQITAGEYFSCALTSGGNLHCWGRNRYGQLGGGTSGDTDVATPQLVAISDVAAVSAGENHVCSVQSSGQVMCWGRTEYGEVGDPRRNSTSSGAVKSPQLVPGLAEVYGLAAGSGASCALRGAGCEVSEVVCWGRDFNGARMGSCAASANAHKPAAVALDPDDPLVAVDLGKDMSCALTRSGDVWCWGSARTPFNALTSTPSRIAGLGAVTQLSIGGVGDADDGQRRHLCVISDGALMCWGDNSTGQIGNNMAGTTVTAPAPVNISAIMP